VLSLYTFASAVLRELDRGEFTTVVCSEHPQTSSSLGLDQCLEPLDRSYIVALDGEKMEPHVSTAIIDEQQKILLTTRSHGRDRSTQVAWTKSMRPSARPLACDRNGFLLCLVATQQSQSWWTRSN
jgi:hypothetical protein